MKRYLPGLLGALLLGGLWVAFIPKADSADPRVKEAMKFKLYYAQTVLEGIALENFELLADGASKLKSLSLSTEWQLHGADPYRQFTRDFVLHTESLKKAAERKNVDAATVAYFQMTVSCVNCHRYLRGSEQAFQGGQTASPL